MLGKFGAELKLVIAGNHDLELDKTYWEAQRDDEGNPEDLEDHGLAVQAMTGPLAAEVGVLSLDEGTHSVRLKSGARFTIYVSPYSTHRLLATGPSHTSTTKIDLTDRTKLLAVSPLLPQTRSQIMSTCHDALAAKMDV